MSTMTLDMVAPMERGPLMNRMGARVIDRNGGVFDVSFFQSPYGGDVYVEAGGIQVRVTIPRLAGRTLGCDYISAYFAECEEW